MKPNEPSVEREVGMPVLKPLTLSDQRAQIVDLLLVPTEDGGPRKLTADDLITGSGLRSNTVYFNMRALAESGWFRLDWEENVDPYDFDRQTVRRRIFLADGVSGPLVLCLEDFRSDARVGKQGRPHVEYVPPVLVDGVPREDFVPLRTGVVQMSPGRTDVLLYCLGKPDEFHHPPVVGHALDQSPNTVRERMASCVHAGLMVSELRPVRGGRDIRVFKLTEAGVVMARRVQALRRGGEDVAG